MNARELLSALQDMASMPAEAGVLSALKILGDALDDARRSGMTEAAELCCNSIQLQGPYFKTLIIAARDKKTP